MARKPTQLRTIARENDELVLIRDVVLDDLWVTCDDLCLRAERLVLLVLEVAQCARQREVAVHTTKLDVAAGVNDASPLG